MGFLKKGVPCTSSKSHAFEVDQPEEDDTDDISVMVFCDADEVDSVVWNYTFPKSARHASRDTYEQIQTPAEEAITPAEEVVASVVEFVGDAEVAQFLAPILKVYLVEDAGRIVSNTVPIESYEEDDSDIDDIIDGYYATSLTDKKGCLYGMSVQYSFWARNLPSASQKVPLPYTVANVISEPEPVKVQLAKPVFTVAAFGAIPLLDQNTSE